MIQPPAQLRNQMVRKLAIVFVLALVARFLFLIVRGSSLSGDSPDYLLLAKNLVTQGSYSLDAFPPLVPSIRRPPLYPFLLAGLSLITNQGGDLSVFWIAAVQVVLDSMVAVIVFGLAQFVVPVRWAFAAGVFYALNPGNIAMTRAILTESVFTALMVGAVLMLVLGIRKERFGFTCWGAGFWGLAVLCRPIAFPLIVLFPVLLLWVSALPRKRMHALAFVSVALLVLTPWIVRCYLVSGKFVLIQGGSAGTLYVPTLNVDQGNEERIWPIIFGKQTSDPYGYYNVRARTAAEMLEADRIGGRLALQNILANPSGYLRSRLSAYPHLFLNSFDSFSGINQSFGNLLAQRDWFRLLIKLLLFLAFSVLPFGLAIIGLCKVRGNIVTTFCAACWGFMLLIHLPMWIEYRFWLPAVPFLIVSAASGAFLLWQKMSPHTKRFTALRVNRVQINA